MNLIDIWISKYSFYGTIHMLTAHYIYSGVDLTILSDIELYNALILPFVDKLNTQYDISNFNINDIIYYIKTVIHFILYGSILPSFYVKKTYNNHYIECDKHEAEYQIVLPPEFYANIDTFKKTIDFNNITNIELAFSYFNLEPWLRRNL